MRYKYGTVGGTFDRLHKGHRKLLQTAFDSCENVYIGIVTEAFVIFSKQESKLPDMIQSYNERLIELKKFINSNRLLERSKIVPINDRFGSTLKDKNLQAIIVSPETELVATEINLLRAQKNWSALEVIVVPWVLASDGKPISSKRIRQGEVDREGKAFKLPVDWGVRYLPASLRSELKNPLGKLYTDDSKDHEGGVRRFLREGFVSSKQSMFVAVGDAVTHALVNQGVIPDISIVDMQIQRKPVFKDIQDLGLRNIKVIKKAKNEAGTINIDAIDKLSSLINSEAKPAVLQIEGEDDLMTLLTIYYLPLESLIVYGQPNEGVVVVTVDEQAKQKVRGMLNSFAQSI